LLAEGKSIKGHGFSDQDTQTTRQLKLYGLLDLSALPTARLNIRANTSPATVGSMVFTLSGQQTHTRTENTAPYALFANKGSDYLAWTPAAGEYTLTATPYEEPRGGGSRGTAKTINFSLVDHGKLELIQTVLPEADMILEGDFVWFVVRLINRGNTAVSNIEVQNVLSGCGALSGIEIDPDAGSVNGVIWKIETLGRKEEVSLVVKGKGSKAGTVFNTASVIKFDQKEPSSENIESVKSMDILRKGEEELFTDLGVSVSVTNERGTLDPVATNEPVIITIRVKNNGPRKQTNVTVQYSYSNPNESAPSIEDEKQFSEIGAGCTDSVQITTFLSYSGDLAAEANITDRANLRNNHATNKIKVGIDLPAGDGLTQPARRSFTGMDKENGEALTAFVFYPSFPNPFNYFTIIHFGLAQESMVQLTMLNEQGILAGHLVNQHLPAGKYSIPWYATHLTSGVYVAKLTAGNVVKTQRIILIR
jgi:hypothetical protein